MSNCVVDADRMQANMDSQNGLILAEKVMIELVDSGLSRDESHEILRSASMIAVTEKTHLREVLESIEVIGQRFNSEQLDLMFDPANHLGVTKIIVDNAVQHAENRLA
jgi:adenylosuccinate lyase